MVLNIKKKKILLFTEIASDVIIALAKFIVGIICKSSVMIAEGFHSFADTTNQIFLLVGLRAGKKPADRLHPFGYGKENFFWALMSAIFILTVSATVAIWKGISQIRNPQEISHFAISYSVLIIALLFQIVCLLFSSKHFWKGIKKRSLKLTFRRLKTIKEPVLINLWLGDIAAIAGTLIAGSALFLVQQTNNVFYDGLASVIIGLILAILAIFLIKDAKDLLIGEAVTPDMYNKIVSLILSVEGVNAVVKLKTMHLTPNKVLVNADLDFGDDLNTQQIEKIIDEIESMLRKEIPVIKQISIEAENKKS